MELSLSSPTSFSHSRLLFLTLKPNPLCIHSVKATCISLPSRPRRFRFSVSADAADAAEAVHPSELSLFGFPKKLTVQQKIVDVLPPPARLASCVVLTGTAMTAGFGLGFRFGGGWAAGLGGAAMLGLAAGAVAFGINSSAPEVAAVNLRNALAGYGDPTELKKEVVDGIVQKYGISRHDEAFREALRDLYIRFVSSVIPPGAENLKGNEVETILKFKTALGIDDPDAAAVHMEIGRHIFRQRLETGDREADAEQRRAFQKLVYISTLVFGEASKFLLPWKRIFKVTDAQVDVAVRDNAQRLFAMKLNSIGSDIVDTQLIDARSSQLLYRLSDEIAAEMFREHTRKLAEVNIACAVNILKSRKQAGRTAIVVEEIEKVLALNNLLLCLTKHPESNKFVPGISPISLVGGEFDSDRKIDDLKLLFRAYAAECFPDGLLEKQKFVALNQLKNIFGLGNREADAILLDITVKVYRKRLSHAVSSGDLDAASSKAVFLQNLCEELHFDPQKASEIHEEIYRQKLLQFVSDGELREEEVSSLLRIRVLLCIPQETVDSAHADICGRLFEKVVKDAIASGVDGYDADIRESVRKAAQGLRLPKDAAMAIAGKAVRKVFLIYVQRSKGAGSKIEAAKELKKMIAFNTLVVTELIFDIKGEPITRDPIEVEINPTEVVEEEWESLQTLRKSRPTEALEAKLGKGGQTEINLKDDLPERDRADIYRTYLLFCLSGEVTVIPFGAQITTKKDDSEYLLLNQLGGILGLTSKEIVEIHRNLAEQAFMKQAEVILADGQLTKSKVDQLSKVQNQVGLPVEYAQKVIKNITTTKMAAAIETAVSQGRIGIQQVRELKEANVNLDSMISVRLRENLFIKTVEEIFSSGTGVFDEVEVYANIPSDLSIDAEKARGVVREIAMQRLSNSLVQAVALLRQKNRDGVVASLNDMLACDTAVPSEPLPWSSPEELADLYCIYLKNVPETERQKLDRLQFLLGISDSSAALLRDSEEKRTLPIENEEEEVFF